MLGLGPGVPSRCSFSAFTGSFYHRSFREHNSGFLGLTFIPGKARGKDQELTSRNEASRIRDQHANMNGMGMGSVVVSHFYILAFLDINMYRFIYLHLYLCVYIYIYPIYIYICTHIGK